MPKLDIFVKDDPEDLQYTDVVFKLDGEIIGFGNYGGEPEDNMRCRDYHWVETIIARISVALGAKVETHIVESPKETK